MLFGTYPIDGETLKSVINKIKAKKSIVSIRKDIKVSK